jgi:hypothetical protein
VVWGLSAEETAAVTDEALHDLPADRPDVPTFEVWRQRIQQRFFEVNSEVTTQ